MAMKRISYKAAVEALSSIFSDPMQDTWSPAEIYQLVGRDMTRAEQNKRWLQNRLTPLKDYGFVKSIYSKSQPKTLDKIQLTQEGKTALQNASNSVPSREVTLESIARDIREFERQNPSIIVEFRTILKRKSEL